MHFPKIQPELQCHGNIQSTEIEHLIIAAKSDDTFKNCVKNFLRLEKVDSDSFSFCTTISVRKNGSVTAVNIKNSNLPRSLSWCIEQQLWSRDFSGLQLNKNVSVSFPTKLLIQKSDN